MNAGAIGRKLRGWLVLKYGVYLNQIKNDTTLGGAVRHQPFDIRTLIDRTYGGAWLAMNAAPVLTQKLAGGVGRFAV
jgi:hypothetical protein